MIRPRNASSLVSTRVALSLVVLGLAGCSFSFRSGGSSSSQKGKPAIANDDEPSGKPVTRKPIAKTDSDAPTRPTKPSQPSQPGVSEPDEGAGPTRRPPAEDPPPVVEPTLTAVCRTQDPTLEALCHRAFDPIAANDLDAWIGQLDERVVVTRPTSRKGKQRVEGPQAVRDLVGRAGGLRAFLHLRPTDRIVGTVANDCRKCRRAVVVFEANTRSGTVAVEVEMTQPPAIVSVDIASQVRRPHLEELRKPEPGTKKPAPTEDRPVITPPEQPEPEAKPTEETQPSLKPVEPRPTKKKKQPQLLAPKEPTQ
jgi:hypothetical protein